MTLLWLIPVGTAFAALAIIGAHRITVRRHTVAPIAPQIRGDCFYINEPRVEELYLQIIGKPPERRVLETDRINRGGNVSAGLRGWGVSSDRRVETEQQSEYIWTERPITMIPKIVRDLEASGEIIAVDLVTRSLEPGTGLDRALREAYGQDAVRRQSDARLSKLRGYALVKGRFQETNRTDETIRFSAPYGGVADLAGQARVDLRCVPRWLRPDHTVPETPFLARCFGQILTWEDGGLAIEPLAIFQQ